MKIFRRLPYHVLLLSLGVCASGLDGSEAESQTIPNAASAEPTLQAEPPNPVRRPVSLKVGDVAPAYHPTEWIQGEPVQSFLPGKVYLIDFTATWCGPCIKAIPHLNGLHQKFGDKGLVVIGQHVLETNPDAVASFVKRFGERLGYRVAQDRRGRMDPDGLLEKWMYSAGFEGIPTAFIVNQQGRVAWIGHPAELEEELVARIVAGEHDLAKAAADYEKEAANRFHIVKRERPQVDLTPRLAVGSPAPPLQVGRWVRGEPVGSFERDKAYLIEFWATWCGPCIKAIPHLTEMQQRYADRGLVVIGQSFSEKNPEAVDAFVKKMGDKMDYRVAIDAMDEGGQGRMHETWVKAAGISAVPTSFLVDKTGKIAWIGHPQNLSETMIDQVLAGTFDSGASIADKRKQVGEVRRRIAASKALAEKIRQEVAAKNWEKAEALVDELAKGEKTSFAYLRLHIAKRDYPAVIRVASDLSERSPDTYSTQYTLLRELAYVENPPADLVDLGIKIGQRAIATQNRKTANLYDALARLRFLKGDQAGAVEMGEQARDALGNEAQKVMYQQAIDLYRQGKLPEGALKISLRGMYVGFEPQNPGNK